MTLETEFAIPGETPNRRGVDEKEDRASNLTPNITRFGVRIFELGSSADKLSLIDLLVSKAS